LWPKILSEKGQEPKLLQQGLLAIERSAQSQTKLIEDLLDISRIVSGKLRLELAETPLAPVVKTAVDSIRPTAAAKEILLTANVPEDIGSVRADADRLRQVIWNLLTNAVKFTPAGGKVELSVVPQDGSVEIRVSDSGDGINSAFLPHVFERFRQSESAMKPKHGGLGLGLAISKQLVDLHSGSLSAESDGPGQGATFTVRLPLLAADRAMAAAQLDELSPGDANLHGLRILLIEDDRATSHVMSIMLSAAGADVTVAESGRAAMEAFKVARPDVLVSDIGLPDLDGYDLIAAIRSFEREQGQARAPAIAISAYASQDDRHRALVAGFQQHFGKPVDPHRLISTIRNLAPA
jgi:hypothetical protein